MYWAELATLKTRCLASAYFGSFLFSFCQIKLTLTLFSKAPYVKHLLHTLLSSFAACAIAVSVPAGITLAQSVASESAVISEEASEKYNAYVKAFNSVNTMFYGSTKGMSDLLEKYKAQRLGERSGGREPTLFMNTSMLRNHTDALRAGVAIADAGPYTKLDQLARRIAVNSIALMKVSREFDDYVDTKKYLDDDFSKGRELNAPIVKGWTQLIQDHDALGAELTAAERMTRLSAIAAARKAGDNLMAATNESMLYARDLIDQFGQASDFGVTGKVQAADAIAVKVEGAQKEMRELAEKGGDETYRHGLIADNIAKVLGSYRTLKSARRASDRDFDDMIERYNAAVKQFDRIP